MKQDISKQIDFLKVVTILLVIWAHVSRMYTGEGVIHMEKNILLTFVTKYIYSFHMPLFVVLSGSIYYICKRLNNKYKIESQFILNKAKRLLIPYIFFAFIIVLPTLIVINAIQKPYINYILNGLILVKDAKHLWFLIMLFGIFVPFNHFESWIAKHRNRTIIIMLIGYVCSFIAPSILQFNAILKYGIYFYIGYNYGKIEKCIEKVRIELWFLSHLAVFTLMTINNFHILNPFFPLITNIFGILMMMSISIYLSKKNKFDKLYTFIKHNSFGIYLFHPMIIYLLFFIIKDEHFNPYLVSIIIFLISLLLSIICINIIKSLKLSIFIGEK